MPNIDVKTIQENVVSKDKQANYIAEIVFAIVVFFSTCPLIPFLLALIHPNFITPYIPLFFFGQIFGIILLISLIAQVIRRFSINPNEYRIKALIIFLITIAGFFMSNPDFRWGAAAQGMYLNLKSKDFSELRNWAKSVQIPQGQDYIRLTDPNIPAAAKEFKPLRVWVYDDDKKFRIASLVWCGGLTQLIVGPVDMPIPDADIRPDHFVLHKIISPGIYITITE